MGPSILLIILSTESYNSLILSPDLQTATAREPVKTKFVDTDFTPAK